MYIFGTASFCEMIHSNGLRLTLSHHLYLHSALYESLIYMQTDSVAGVRNVAGGTGEGKTLVEWIHNTSIP